MSITAMTFLQKTSAHSLGILTDKDLPEIAMTGLEEGFDSTSLRMLAGCSSNENAFQLSEYYTTSLKELNIIEPKNKEALISVVRSYADKIIDGHIDPYQVFEEIDKVIDKTQFDYSDIMLDECYADHI